MRTSTIYLFLLFIFFLPFNALGAIKDVTITWTMPDTTDVTGYKMYYSYDSSMAEKILACETNDPAVTTLTCENINLEFSPVYFVIAALHSGSELNSTAIGETIITKISTVKDFSIAIPPDNNTLLPPSSADNKLYWAASSDSIEKPVGKSAVRAGNGQYTYTGCFQDVCYDNTSNSNFVRIPIVAEDILNQDEFEIEFHFNPQRLADYNYLFGIGRDANNSHLVHMYADGRLYCRTTLNGASYFGYILNSDEAVRVGNWYKLNYIYSRTRGYIKILINDELKIDIKTTEIMQGEANNIYLASDYRGNQRADCLLDEVTIK